MHKFKIGDKVRYKRRNNLRDQGDFIINKIYTIINILPGNLIDIDEKINYYVYSDQLELYNPCEEILNDIINS